MQFFGRATVAVDGKRLESMPGASIDIGGFTRTPKSGDHAHGYTESPKNALVECEVIMTGDTSLADLAATVNATVTFKCDTGQTYVVRGAWLVETPKVTGGDTGTVSLQFAGPPAEEVS